MSRRAWLEQAWVVMVLAVLAVVLNALTTGDHLLSSLARGYWPVAAIDLVLLLTALIAFAVLRRQARKQKTVSAEKTSPVLEAGQTAESLS